METNPRTVQNSCDRFFQNDADTAYQGFQIPQEVGVIHPTLSYNDTGDRSGYLTLNVFVAIDEPSYAAPLDPYNFRSLQDNEQLQIQYEFYGFEISQI